MTKRIAGVQIVLISSLVLMAAKVAAGPLPQATAASRAAAAPTPTPPQRREGQAGPAAAAAPGLAGPATSASSSTAIFNIASMTPDERMRLPDNTMVKLESGRTASLGTLRAEHRARLARFAQAAALGQIAAGQLQPASSFTQPNPAATSRPRSVTGPAQQSGIGNQGALPPDISTQAKVGGGGSLVPFQALNYLGSTPKDWVDFCKAAGATVCVYLPANTTFTMFSSPNWVEDIDPLITDGGVCKYDGGLPAYNGCHFFYLYNHVVNFKPSGALSSKASCKLPAKFIVDPKGAAQASYAFSGQSFSTGGTPITCVIQVWVSP